MAVAVRSRRRSTMAFGSIRRTARSSSSTRPVGSTARLLAVSDDGVNWRRPKLAAVPGTNAVIAHPPGHHRDGALVWLDHDGAPDERFKMFVYWRWAKQTRQAGKVYTSPDGARWSERGVVSPCGDNNQLLLQPVPAEVACSASATVGTCVRAATTSTANSLCAGRWHEAATVRWAPHRPPRQAGPVPRRPAAALRRECRCLREHHARRVRDLPRPRELPAPRNSAARRSTICSSPTAATGSIGIGRTEQPSSPQAGIGAAWDYGYIHAAGGVCLVVGDELWFYYGAFSGQGSILKAGRNGGYPQDNAMYAGGHTGLATLRRDGFASMETEARRASWRRDR